MEHKWTREKIIDAAKKYKTVKDFLSNDHAAYVAAQKRNMLSNDLKWLERKKNYHPRGYWTFEKALEESKKYATLKELIENNSGLYTVMIRNKWLEQAPWLKRLANEKGYWTRDKIIEESKKYTSKADFKFFSQVAYKKASDMGLFSEMPWLDIKDIRGVNDCIYGYFFEGFNTVYIGRTIERRIRARDREHRNSENNDVVYKFAKKKRVPIPEMKIIESGLTISNGIEREEFWEKHYRDNGFETLNIAKCGSIGSLKTGKWNKLTITEEAKKYKTRNEFRLKNQTAYYASIKFNLLDTFHWMPKRNNVKRGFWTEKENIISESKKYKNKTEFAKKCSRAYYEARKNGYLEEMIWLNKKEKE